MLSFLDKNFTRKNIYLVALVGIVAFWLLSFLLVEDTAQKIRLAIFNPFWPLLLLIIDTILEEKKKEEDLNNKITLKKIKALLGDRSTNYDRRYLLAVIEGLEEEVSAKEAADYMQSEIDTANPIS